LTGWETAQGQPVKSVRFAVESAYETRRECEREGKARTVNLVQEPGTWRSYRCIPDTVDPRGPKGGGR
jgi:hypothetical protein